MFLRNSIRAYLLGLITSIRNVILSSFSFNTVLIPSAAGTTAPGGFAISGLGWAGVTPGGVTPAGRILGWGGGCGMLAGPPGVGAGGPGPPTPTDSVTGST